MKPGNPWVMAALVFLVARTALAQGGPPFRTDDPDKWEINLGLIGGPRLLCLPNFDVNYGLGDHITPKAK